MKERLKTQLSSKLTFYRILLFIIITNILPNACSTIDEDQTSSRFFISVLVIIIIILGLAFYLLARILKLITRNWQNFSIFGGFVIGIFCGLAIILKVPLNIQYLVLGSFLGIGSDKLIAKVKKTKPETVIDNLTRLIIKLSTSINKVSNQTGIGKINSVAINLFIWTIIMTILLMLLIGNVVSPVLKMLQ